MSVAVMSSMDLQKLQFACSRHIDLVSRAIRYGKNIPYGEDVLTVLGLRRNVGMANEIAAYV